MTGKEPSTELFTDPLMEQLDAAPPESWVPKEAGESITGVLLRVEQGQTQFGPAPIVVLMTNDGERSVWLLSEALRSGFGRARPAAGERVGIKYLGKTKVKNQTPGRAGEYHNFKVVVDRPEGQPVSWNEILSTGSTAEPAADAVDPDEDLPF